MELEKPKYTPSFRDIHDAEKSMTEGQRRLSEDREELHRIQEVRGIKSLEWSKREEAGTGRVIETVWGIIKGHAVALELTKISTYDNKGDIKGVVDGMDLADEDAKKIWEKYNHAARDGEAEAIAIQKSNAKDKKDVEQAEISIKTSEALKDLLG